jgi:hypothetical protein
MNNFVLGCLLMASFVAGLFFFRFWRETRDRLFAMFAVAFWIFAISRLAVIIISSSEAPLFVYMGRLLAFCLILIAIIDKNRQAR